MARFQRELSVEGWLEDQLNQETMAVGLNVLSGVTLATPVDTGRARGNWQVEINRQKTDELKSEDKSGGRTIAAGSETIGTARSLEYFKIYITNNLPYIGALNSGSSTQAPRQFVESVIARVVGRGNLNG